MRQRNDTGYTQQVSAWPTDEYPDLVPFEVPPGEECDHPELLAGFTAVEALEPEPVAPASTPSKPAKKSAAVPATSTEGGEPA